MRTGSGRRLVKAGETVVGVPELRALFKAMPDQMQRELMADCVAAASATVLAEEQRTVPVGATRTLYNSLQIFPVRKTKNYTRQSVGAGKEGWYGRFLEYGFTARDGTDVPARPWLRPALASAFPPAVGAFRREFRSAFDPLVEELADRYGTLGAT
jgi:hypothetical protein